MKPNLNIRLLGKTISSFHLFGIVGYVAGILLGVWLAIQLNLSVAIILLLSLAGAITFFLLVFVWKLFAGREELVYYQHEISILLVSTILLILLDQPVLPYLEITLLGIGTFLAFGRIGCFNVGCCHGLPVKKGVVYSEEHVLAGFPPYYKGVPLFPIQLLESACVFGIVITGAYLLYHNYPSGSTLLWYTLAYGAIRFILEFWRGDPERPYCFGLSEAQWTTLILMSGMMVGGITETLPVQPWHIGVWLGLLGVGVFVMGNTDLLFYPAHRREVFLKVMNLKKQLFHNGVLSARPEKIKIEETTKGLCISLSHNKIQPMWDYHLAISMKNSMFNAEQARRLAQEIISMHFSGSHFHIYPGKQGVYHIFIMIKKENYGRNK